MTILTPIQLHAARRHLARQDRQGDAGGGLGGVCVELAYPAQDGDAAQDPVSLRQLRHQTKNALQRILGQVGQDKALRRTREGRRLIEDLQNRIVLSARISDALFGLTRAPGPLHARLAALGESVVELLGDPDQVIHLDVSVSGECPAGLDGVLLRVAHEFLGNAVKHGMHARLVGRIRLGLRCEPGHTRLEVADDGWGCGADPAYGEGLAVAVALAARHGGRIGLHRRGDATIATLDLPQGASGPT